MINIEFYKKRLERLKNSINNELEEYFDEKLKECNDNEINNVINELKNFTLNGGKRLRPILMITSYNIFKEIDEKIIKASISIEMAQSFLLIHDDIMDNSDLRRGKLSFHKAIEKTVKDKKIAENIAISAGDLVDTFSHEALLKSGFEINNLLKADYEFSKVIEDTGKGQILDIYSSIDNNYSEEKLFKLHYLKTARYTIEGPVLIGAYLSGDNKYINNLKNFGINAGITFQLYDDVLGIFGDENKTGKSIKSDVNEGKKTLLIIKAYENSDNNDRNFIDKAIKNGNINDDDFNKLKNIIKNSGSYDYSMKKINELTLNAKKELKNINGNNEAIDMLNFLLDYIIKRDN